MTACVVLVADVARLNVALELLALTTVSWGTRAIAGLLLDSCTTAPCVMAPENRTVPVAFCPATIDVGTNETDVSDGPAGVAAFTERVWVREMLSGVAPMIWTLVAGAEAVDVIVNMPLVWPAGIVDRDRHLCRARVTGEQPHHGGRRVREAQLHGARGRRPAADRVRVDVQRADAPGCHRRSRKQGHAEESQAQQQDGASQRPSHLRPACSPGPVAPGSVRLRRDVSASSHAVRE
ncbi:MAG TPA: hypothetical protein VMT27_08610, partial [Actinomycetes bacterium]|nr:hypothetical protein [Actinomycetes bacterium]